MQTPVDQINPTQQTVPRTPLVHRYRSINLQGEFRRNLFTTEFVQTPDDVTRPLPYVSRSSHHDIFSFFESKEASSLVASPEPVKVGRKPSIRNTNEEKVREAKDLAFNLYLAIKAELLEDLLVPRPELSVEARVLRATRSVTRKRKRSTR
jgi:hypothetical protein